MQTDLTLREIEQEVGFDTVPVDEAKWSEPEPLPEGLPPVAELDTDMIPEQLRAWITDVADRMQVPPDFTATPTIVSMGSLIGRKVAICPKQRDNWLVVPNLWGFIVGPPSVMKSPAVAGAMHPLNKLVSDAITRYQHDRKDYEVDFEIAQAKISQWKADLRAAGKDSDDATIEHLRAARPEEPAKPTAKRYKTEDPTVEKLGELLLENPDGLFVFRDELSGWLRNLDKPGRESDRAFYLEAWKGTDSYTVDRIGRGTLHIPALCLSLFGTIQPGPLHDYIYAALKDGTGNDGLIQRFQMLVWPNVPSTWQNVDRCPNSVASDRVHGIFEKLDTVDAAAIGAKPLYEDAIPTVRFSAEAQEIFNAWRTQLEWRLRHGEIEPDALLAHLAKYRSLMPSLALIFHLVSIMDGQPPEPVGKKPTLMAASWCAYLESHARRLYSSIKHPTVESARALLKRIQGRDIKDGFTARDIYRNCWSRLASRDDVQGALQVLADFSWVRPETVPTDGKAKTVIRIHPSLRSAP